jgi:hypothetical protein
MTINNEIYCSSKFHKNVLSSNVRNFKHARFPFQLDRDYRLTPGSMSEIDIARSVKYSVSRVGECLLIAIQL